jgi:hypothetical protein
VKAQTYLDAILLKLTTSLIIKSVEVVQERSLEDRGFVRVRLRLVNDDFVEVAEFFVIAQGQVQTVEYRYQWMDPDQKHLRKRWDNARHYPDLPNFPHHVHVEDENTVEPGHPMGIVELIEVLEHTIGKSATTTPTG